LRISMVISQPAVYFFILAEFGLCRRRACQRS
jgi:hypothetical protein